MNEYTLCYSLNVNSNMYNRSKLCSENTIFCFFLDLFGLMEIWNAKVAVCSQYPIQEE